MICCVGRYNCEQQLVDHRGQSTSSPFCFCRVLPTSYTTIIVPIQFRTHFKKKRGARSKYPSSLLSTMNIIVGVRSMMLDGDVLQNREYACALSLDLSSRHIFYLLDLALPAISFGSFFPPLSIGSSASRHIFWIESHARR